jgi:hypothetical protein
MEYDLTNPGEAVQSVDQSTLAKEFIPTFGITEIPDFETFSLDPDKYLAQVTDPNNPEMQATQEAMPTENGTQEESLPPVENIEGSGETVQASAQASNNDMPRAQASAQASANDMPGAQDSKSEDNNERETLQ